METITKEGVKMKQKFERRIFTTGILLHDMKFLFSSMPKMISLARDEKITKVFIEKIMTVVTAVNGCTYCTWFHAQQAVASGISDEEIKNMLNLQFKADASDFELMALLYAQHFAETNRNPDKDMTDKLIDYYRRKTANHIILVIRMIFFGNLLGNTFDAFLSRLKGTPAENSNAIFETFFFIFVAPFMLPAIPLAKDYRRK
jgi:AhpD family alkylhydroperoxidase